jgi:hypothetical protein
MSWDLSASQGSRGILRTGDEVYHSSIQEMGAECGGTNSFHFLL